MLIDIIMMTSSQKPLFLMMLNTCPPKAAARWFVRCGILDQFKVAHEIELEDVSEYAPFQALT
jgi:hypothetical protein